MLLSEVLGRKGHNGDKLSLITGTGAIKTWVISAKRNTGGVRDLAMTQYVVFLRGVNMGGHNKLKMSDVCQRFGSLGFERVASYKQSGNILFETAVTDSDRISQGIRREIHGLLGKDIEIYLRTMSQIREMIRRDPFKDIDPTSAKAFVTFLPAEPPEVSGLPLKSPEGDAEVILIRGCEVFGVGYLKNGRYGESYGKLLARFGSSGTTRNWNTIKGIAALAALRIP
jgi:uncharacterized protein (DUF1697 family)